MAQTRKQPPPATDAAEAADRRQMRLAGAVIAIAMLAWLGVQWIGGQMGWPGKYVFLADLAAIGAMIWSLMVTWRIWRRRNASSHGQG